MPDTTAPPLDLADVAARIDRHAGKEPNPRVGDPRFVDLCRLVDHDTPALLKVATTALAALTKLTDAAEDVLAEAEQAETDALFSAAAEPSCMRSARMKALREAINALPAGLPEVPGEASCD